MTEQYPKISQLNPIVMPDKRRVMLEMTVDNLPTVFSNVAFTMPDMLDQPPTAPPKPDPDAPSPYPDIVLSILTSNEQEVASMLIVEHKEKYTSLTLHLRRPADPTEQYTARAEMTYQGKALDTVDVPFTLDQAG